MRSSVRDWQNKSDEELIALLRKAESGKDTENISLTSTEEASVRYKKDDSETSTEEVSVKHTEDDCEQSIKETTVEHTEKQSEQATEQSQIIDYLLEKYKNLVRKKANALFLLGGDTDDLIQEGMIGLFKAVRDYDPAGGSSFYSFAGLCITRQMYKAVEAAARKKHSPLNSYVSLSDSGDMEVDAMLFQEPAQSEGNPERILLQQEQMEQLLEQMQDALSPMERQVLNLYLSGNNYHQIAKILDKPEKSIDNALQRIRQKLRQ